MSETTDRIHANLVELDPYVLATRITHAIMDLRWCANVARDGEHIEVMLDVAANLEGIKR